ncbi:MAG: beta-galactosidase [Clostridia bacterium]|nr:beta-galactosidase [Clostridia bacterium]
MTTRNAYPRPELVRENWLNLCGEWEFEFDFGCSGRARGVQKKEKLERTIQVPFCPESKLSGIEYTDFINACWYRKTVNLVPKAGERTLINFEAAYYQTEVYVNGTFIGRHKGGYTPFSFDITDALTAGDNSIAVCCEGDARDMTQPSGKQCERYHSYGCMYTRSTGIYAPVWIETVPALYVKSVKLDPDTDNSRLFCELALSCQGEKSVTLTATLDGKTVGKSTVKTTAKIVKTTVELDTLSLWSIETPTLYDLIIEVANADSIDRVVSYFGMRTIEMDDKCLRINGKRVFQRLVLDQGYYPEGIYTAPTDDAFAKDIVLSQRIGFNGARLHERVFERRFLYEADKRGYIVWGEYPNWGFDYANPANTHIYLHEWMEAMTRDYNHPALIGWCPFNETWDIKGKQQSDDMLRIIYEQTKYFDPVRPCIDTSGNYHVVTDIYDIHDYNQSPEAFQRRYSAMTETEVFENYGRRQRYGGQPYFISEYGGIKWAKELENDREQSWGYGDAPKSIDEYVERFVGLTSVLMDTEKICGLCYTQLYDVEQEQNGVYYYDRTPKFTEETMDKLAAVLKRPAAIEKK